MYHLELLLSVLTIDNLEFQKPISDINPTELQLNKESWTKKLYQTKKIVSGI